MVIRPTSRHGKSSLGCLVSLLLVVAIGYFAVNIGEVYFRYYQFRDSMQQAAQFASRLSDDDIRTRLRLAADSLGLPEAAQKVQIRRREHSIVVSNDYYEHVELPGYVREIHFQPRAESSF